MHFISIYSVLLTSAGNEAISSNSGIPWWITVAGIFSMFAMATIIAWIAHWFDKKKSVLEWMEVILGIIGKAFSFLTVCCISITLFLFLILFVWVFVWFPLKWTSSLEWQGWFVIVLVLCFSYFIFILNYSGRKQFYSLFKPGFREDKDEKPVKSDSLRKLTDDFKGAFGKFYPLAFLIGLVMAGSTCFAAWAALLNVNGYLAVDPKPSGLDIGRFADFFLWHFCDLIPEIEMNKTIGWEIPMKYSDNGTGWLLLLFKVVMSYVVIARFYTWNKWRKVPEEGDLPSGKSSLLPASDEQFQS